MGRAAGEKTIPGAFELFAGSESTFFTKLDEGMEMQFLMNERGAVQSLIHRQSGMPTCEGVRRTP